MGQLYIHSILISFTQQFIELMGLFLILDKLSSKKVMSSKEFRIYIL